MKCAECLEKQLRERGSINYWYCENRCRKGKEEHEKERGTDWDKMDKQSSAYKGATLNGD